jgi:uncharacterized protein (DUF4415 family)
MKRKPNPEMIDTENPEWTEAVFARAVPFSKLPKSLQAKLSSRTRGPQKTPTKERISIRLSPDVVQQFRATGDGWQTRVDAALKDWLNNHTPA